MIKSMTGYGRGQSETDGLVFSIEIKAVNHRYGDINIKAPRLLAPLEPEIKKRIQEVVKRGKVDLYINQENRGRLAVAPVVNEPLVAAYVAAFARLQEVAGVASGVSLEFLAAQKDVMQLQETEVSADAFEPCLYEALDKALQVFLEMRRAEGEATAADIRQRLEVLEEVLGKVQERAPEVPKEWQVKLEERLGRLQEQAGDPQRIAQEIAIFADRCDVSEEISRFTSHLQQFQDLMLADEPVGRQMDFLVQELNREANTMGSKSNDAELTRYVVILKSELEKIREQVQNIE